MKTKIRKVKYMPEYKNPNYKVILETPDGKELRIRFDYTHAMGKYMPLEVNYDGEDKGAKLAWYTKEVEHVTVDHFLQAIAAKINKKYNVQNPI